MAAAWQGHLDVVKLLVALKANPNIVRWRWPALHRATPPQRGGRTCVRPTPRGHPKTSVPDRCSRSTPRMATLPDDSRERMRPKERAGGGLRIRIPPAGACRLPHLPWPCRDCVCVCVYVCGCVGGCACVRCAALASPAQLAGSQRASLRAGQQPQGRGRVASPTARGASSSSSSSSSSLRWRTCAHCLACAYRGVACVRACVELQQPHRAQQHPHGHPCRIHVYTTRMCHCPPKQVDKLAVLQDVLSLANGEQPTAENVTCPFKALVPRPKLV
jgi:hypothetical protein